MGKAAKPTLITLVLSGAAVLGYLTYRFALDEPAAPRDSAPVATESADEPTPVAAESAEAEARPLPNQLPDFSLVNLDGAPQSIRSWPGQPLIVNFWATWCAPCLREIPMLKEFQQANPDLTVVGIAVDRDLEVQQFADEMEFNYPILIGRTEAVNAAASFGVDFYALPFTIFTDAEGRTLGVRTGELHQEHLDDLLAVLEDLAAGRTSLEDARARIAGVM